VVLHLGVIQIVEQERGAFFYDNGVVSPIEWRQRLKRDLVLDGGRREEIASDEYEL
jgi:hypothetical protein